MSHLSATGWLPEGARCSAEGVVFRFDILLAIPENHACSIQDADLRLCHNLRNDIFTRNDQTRRAAKSPLIRVSRQRWGGSARTLLSRLRRSFAHPRVIDVLSVCSRLAFSRRVFGVRNFADDETHLVNRELADAESLRFLCPQNPVSCRRFSS